MSENKVDVTPVSGKADLDEFIDLAYRLNRDDSAWVPPLRGEVAELLTPGKNPFFEHAKVQLFLARRDGRAVGRISAHFDELALEQPPEQGMGPGTGNWGLIEAEDERTAHALIARAEQWLRDEGLVRALAPISLSIWEEPGLLVSGHATQPTIMMGHHNPAYQAWIERFGYADAQTLLTYDLEVKNGFPPLINRIVASGEKNSRINIRRVDKANWDSEVEIVVDILNDAWSRNWGFVPFTRSEVRYGAKKLKPIIVPEMNLIAEFEGEPVAFMLTFPDMNQLLAKMNGKLFPFNWIRLLWWLRNPKSRMMRVPLMGVRKKLQNSRLASQLAFMMIEYIRREAVSKYGAERAEIGWILADNQGMRAIADAIDSKVNREYRIYDKAL